MESFLGCMEAYQSAKVCPGDAETIQNASCKQFLHHLFLIPNFLRKILKKSGHFHIVVSLDECRVRSASVQ